MSEGGGVPTGAGEQRIKVVIVDDHALVRSGLEVVLGLFDDIELVGQADDGAEAVAAVWETQPDVVLMDLVMPGVDGVEATREILATLPGTKVLALTSFSDEALIESAERRRHRLPHEEHLGRPTRGGHPRGHAGRPRWPRRRPTC